MTETKFKINGVLPSPIDERDYTYSMISQVSTTEIVIPNDYLLNYQFAPKNQGQIGSCVAYSISEMNEIVRAMDKTLSPGYIYANRAESDFQGKGMIPREALAQLVKHGIPYNELFPINEEYPSIKDTLKKYPVGVIESDAVTRKSKSYLKLNKDEVKEYIFKEKKPVLITVSVYQSFYQTKNGIVPAPSGLKQGSHAMLIVGWDNKGNFIVLNSWGEWGGNKGYLLISIDSPIYNEFWSVTDIAVIKPITPKPDPNSPIIRPNINSFYKVQLGAFKGRENADILSKELLTKGIANCIVIYPNLFKVQVGAFKVKENANEMLNKMISLGYKDAFIVTVI